MNKNKDQIIANAFSEIKDFYDQHGRIPIRREREAINTIARRYFGTWNNFIAAAGYQPNVKKTTAQITEELFKMVHDFYQLHGRIPMRREFTRKNGTICKYFGSWNKFIAAAGYEPNSRRVPSKMKLKNSLLQYYLKHQKVPTIGDCRAKNGLYNHLSYFTHFGLNSWPDVLEYVGLRPYFRITTMTDAEAKEEVINLIKKHKIKYGKTYEKLKPENFPSLWYLKEKFGWNNLCYMAGTKIPVTKFSVKDHYLNLKKNKSKPTAKELAKKMKISPSGIVWNLNQPLNDFILSIGHEPAHKTPTRCKLTKKQLAELYKTKSLAHGYPNGMPRDKLQELTGYSRDIYEKRFFSMNGLRLVCHFKLTFRGGKKYSEEELRDILNKPPYRNHR